MANIIKKAGIAFLVFIFLFFARGPIVSGQTDVSKIAVTVTEKSGKDLKNYQVSVDFNESNFSFDVGKDKISFVDESGVKLSFWIEEWNFGAKTAKIWVKIPELKANETKTIYMDLNGLELPDGNGTFDFFDDFEYSDSFTNHGWADVSSCRSREITTSTDYSASGMRSLRMSDPCNSDDDYVQKSAPFGAGKYIVELSVRKEEQNRESVFRLYLLDNNSEAIAEEINFGGPVLSFFYFPSHANIQSSANVSRWYKMSAIYDNASGKIEDVWIDNVPKSSSKNYTNLNIPSYIVLATGGGSPMTIYIDSVRMRKYISPEPEVSLGEDVSIRYKSVSIVKEGANFFSIKGKVFSTFKDSLKNLEVAVYSDDPDKNSSQELGYGVIGEIEKGKEKEFEINLTLKPADEKITEFYVLIDPDKKIPDSNKENNLVKVKVPDDIIGTISPLLLNIAIFIFVFIFLFIIYRQYKAAKADSYSLNPVKEIKTCLKCGMIIDQGQPKCPVCGMAVFRR